MTEQSQGEFTLCGCLLQISPILVNPLLPRIYLYGNLATLRIFPICFSVTKIVISRDRYLRWSLREGARVGD